ncbi:MAG TPA: HEAT repeat domain-containing protein [Planctomycetota bacterium]|nr:HEAT repeat domain-containing protein [Planctomycetota bacterium]
MFQSASHQLQSDIAGPRVPASPRLRVCIALAAIALASAARAETPTPAPHVVERIMGKDAAGWVEHLKRFENEFERKKAMLCLMEFGSDAADAVPELRVLMKDELQVETQRFAIITLGHIGSAAKPAVPDLLAALNDPNRPAPHKAAALASLAQIDPQAPAVRKAVLAAVRSESPEIRAEALDALVTIAPYEPVAITTLNKSLLLAADAKQAANAFLCMGAAGVEHLLKGLERGEPETRIACAEALSALGSDAARVLPAVLKAAKRERDAAARAPYVLAAARIAPQDAAVLDLLSEQLAAVVSPPLEGGGRGRGDAADAQELPKIPLEGRLLVAAKEAAMPAIQKGLRSRDARVRLQFVELLPLLPKSADVAHELLSRAQDRDNAVAMAAIKALDALGPAAASTKDGLEELAANTALEAPLRRAALLAALNVSRDEKAPRHRSPYEKKSDAEILTLLRNPNADVRRDAAEALFASREDNPELAQALIAALSDPEEKVRIAAARSLVRFGKYTREQLPTFTEWLESENIALRKAALAALAGMGADARPAMDVLVAAALSPSADSDAEMRKLLAVALRMIGPDAVPKLVESLKAKDAEVRARAARAIASMKDVAATAIPDLIELTKSAVDSDAQAGFAALQAMGNVAYHVAGPHLIETLRADAFAERRKWATWALGEIKIPPPPEGDKLKVVDALMEALLDTDPAVCRGAHGALVGIGEAALPRLRDFLRIGEGETPYWAVRVMARLKADPADVIPRLAELTLPGKLPVERGVAAELLGEYAPAHKEIIPILLRVLSDREDYVARAAIRSLALFGEEAIPSVRALLKNRNPLLRRRVIEALAGIREQIEK